MRCPTCKTELVEGQCPVCGARVSVDADSTPSAQATLDTISFSIASQRQDRGASKFGDWRTELKAKLQNHHLRKRANLTAAEKGLEPKREHKPRRLELPRRKKPPRRTAPPAAEIGELSLTSEARASDEEEVRPTRKAAEVDRGEVVKQLFKYKLEDAGKLRERRIITFSKSKTKPSAIISQTELQHTPATQPPAVPPGSPGQGQLNLEPVEAAAQEASATPAPRAGRRLQPVSIVEIVFSRLLAGIIDSSLAVGLGFGFAWLASSLSGVAFPTWDGLMIAAGCAWMLFILNQVFFLSTLRQTPGMLMTELQLESEKGEAPPFRDVLLRTVLWVPSVLSIAGLVWALLDSQGRCFHDLLSRTRISPA